MRVTGTTRSTPTARSSPRQERLRAQLVRALTSAVTAGKESDAALKSAQCAYREVACVLVALRHEFTTSDGVTPDLKGRSAAYRSIVRGAYEQVGAAGNGPIEKRLTAGTAYWVRKLLIDKYGERTLREIGALQPRRRVVRCALERLSDPCESFAAAADILNVLAANISFSPSEQTLRSITRAVVLLRRRLGADHELDVA
jgi:hypothetical protein